MKIKAPVEPSRGVLRIPRAPEGSKVVGQTPNGDNIYERYIVELVRDEHGRVVQDQAKGPGGEDLWLKHPTTGVPIRPMKRNRTRRRKQRFIIQVETNQRGVATGMHSIVEWTPDMASQQSQAGERAKFKEFQDKLISEAMERGISADDLMERILSGAEKPPAGVEVVEPQEPRRPRHPIWDTGVRDLPEMLAGIEDPATLAELHEMETANPDHKGGRSTALKAIAERAGELEQGTGDEKQAGTPEQELAEL